MTIAIEELSLSGNSLVGEAGKALWGLLTTIRLHSNLTRLALAATQLNFGQIMLELGFIVPLTLFFHYFILFLSNAFIRLIRAGYS